MNLFDIIIILMFLYLAYSVVRWVLGMVWALVSWVFSFIDPRPAARMRRIVKHTRRQHQALGEIYLSEMQSISDKAARDIIKTRR